MTYHPPGENIPPPPQPALPVPPPPLVPGPRRFSILTAILLAGVHPKLWRDVARNWRGIGLLYMLVLLLLTWLPVMVMAKFSFTQFVEEDAPQLVSQLPAVTINNGVVSIDKPEPYFINDPETGQPLVVFDTTGDTEDPPETAPSALVTQSEVIMRKSENELRVYDLSDIQSFYVDSARVTGWLEMARDWFFWIGYPFVVIFSLIWRLILMLIAGGIAMAFASRVNARISYAGAMRLSAIAMTPGIILWTILGLLGWGELGCVDEFIGMAITITFLLFAVNANSEPENPLGYMRGWQ